MTVCKAGPGRYFARQPTAAFHGATVTAAAAPLPAPLARLLVDCNQLAVDIDNEIVVVYNFIRDKASTSVHLWCRAACIGHCAALAVRCTPPLSASNSRSPTLPFPLQYKTKFPELESLVHSPLEYARVVQVGGCRRV